MAEKDKTTTQEPRPQHSVGVSRRSLLRTGATALAVSQVPIVSAKDSEKIYERSLELRQKKNWTVEQWRDYLRDKGATVRGQRAMYDSNGNEIQDGSGGDVSTEWTDKGDIELNLSYINWSNYDNFEMLYRMHYNDFDDGPNSVNEVVKIGFNANHYSADGYYYGNYTYNIDGRQSERPCGMVAEWDNAEDNFAGDESNSNFDDSYIGMRLHPNSSYGECERRLYWVYYHTANSLKIETIGASAAGPTITFSSGTTIKFDVEGNQDECKF